MKAALDRDIRTYPDSTNNQCLGQTVNPNKFSICLALAWLHFCTFVSVYTELASAISVSGCWNEIPRAVKSALVHASPGRMSAMPKTAVPGGKLEAVTGHVISAHVTAGHRVTVQQL